MRFEANANAGPLPQTLVCPQEVLSLSRALAVRTLQLEMEYAARALEDEVCDILGSDVDGEWRVCEVVVVYAGFSGLVVGWAGAGCVMGQGMCMNVAGSQTCSSNDFICVPCMHACPHTHADLLSRQGSTSELRLLAAEFTYLDSTLSALASRLLLEGAGTGASAGGLPASLEFDVSAAGLAAGEGAAAGVAAAGGAAGASAASAPSGNAMVSVEELLATLANEVPDLRQRMGVA